MFKENFYVFVFNLYVVKNSSVTPIFALLILDKIPLIRKVLRLTLVHLCSEQNAIKSRAQYLKLCGSLII